MRYDAGIPIDRIRTLESVVDALLGIEEDSIEMNGVFFHRDSEYIAGIMTEEDIRKFAMAFEYNGRWYGFNMTNAILNGIDYMNSARTAVGQAPESFTDYELNLIRSEFIERFSLRLKKYAMGRRLAINDDGGDVVGFKWT